jgi:hypothetical protein
MHRTLRIDLLRRHFTKRQGIATEKTAFRGGVASSGIEAEEIDARLVATSKSGFVLRSASRTASHEPSSRTSQLVGPATARRNLRAPRPAIHGGQRDQSQRVAGLPPSPVTPSCGSIQIMVATLVRPARMPNPSVNLTRNSAPHWPGIARYAHNAMPVQCVTLSHAGYLKR